MTWWITDPTVRRVWHGLGNSLSCMTKDFNYHYHVSMEEWYKLTSCKYLLLRQHIVWARMTYRYCQFLTSRLPGSLKQTRGSGCLSWQPNDSARFRLRRILRPRFILSLLVLCNQVSTIWKHICTDRSITISQTVQYKFNCDGGRHYRQIIW